MDLQVGETTIHTALLSKCIRAVWCAHEAGASCICPDVWQEKERLQEGKKILTDKFIYKLTIWHWLTF